MENIGFWGTLGIVVIVAVLGWIGHAVWAHLQKRLEINRMLAQDRRNLYKRFLELLFEILQSTIKKENIDSSRYEKDMTDLTRDMTVFASDRVLKHYIQFRTMAFAGESERKPKEFISWLGEIILAMRKDLGYTGTKISGTDILRTFIVDVNKYF